MPGDTVNRREGHHRPSPPSEGQVLDVMAETGFIEEKTSEPTLKAHQEVNRKRSPWMGGLSGGGATIAKSKTFRMASRKGRLTDVTEIWVCAGEPRGRSSGNNRGRVLNRDICEP